MPYWGIFSFWLRFVNLHWFAWLSPFMRYMSSWWFYFILWWFHFILWWFPSEVFLESFSQAHTFWYFRDYLMELSQVHRLPYHHFSGAHVRSFIHPHWVILESSRRTKCTSCYTGAYFPRLPTWQDASVAILGHIPIFCYGDDRLLAELLPFSLFRWGIFIHITRYNIDDLCRDEPSEEPDL